MYIENLKRLRLKEKYTQADLAYKLGVSPSAYAMYERGEREPGIEIINSLADIFNVTTDVLLGRKTQSPSPLSEGEQKLLELFKEVPEEQQGMLLEMIEVALKNRK
jgi:transcriptional regulator with XRE-family HTH domain